MSDDKQPMQANGSGSAPATFASRPDTPGQTGESGGGPYPNPHSSKKPGSDAPDRFMGHGGQTGQEYHGSEEGGEANAASKGDKD